MAPLRPEELSSQGFNWSENRLAGHSGNSHWVHWRWSCPTFLRQSFVEWAALTIPRSFWANAFYRQQRAAGKSHQSALRSLAYKWIRIIHRCWIDRQPYDESIYLNALKKRSSPLLAFIAADAAQKPA